MEVTLFVRPHAAPRVRPNTTGGAPGYAAPMQSIPGADRCCSYHMPGNETGQCGSEANAGLPDVVMDGPATQLFEPVPSSPPPSVRELPTSLTGTINSPDSDVSMSSATSGSAYLSRRSAATICCKRPVRVHQKYLRTARESTGVHASGSYSRISNSTGKLSSVSSIHLLTPDA